VSRIHINRFLGIAPKLGDTVLDERQAVKATNAKLWSQKLRAFNGDAQVELITKTGEIKTLYLYNGGADWLYWTQDVNAVPGPIAGDTLEKLYFTGTDTPRVTTNDIFDDNVVGTNRPPDSYILGIPAPDTAPVATDNAAGNISATATWVFTFVRKFSDGSEDESAPSPVSNSLTLAARQASVTLPNGSMTTPANYGVTHKNLYRNEGSGYLFVAQVAISTSPTIDNVATVNLGDLLATATYLPPPDGMIGLVALANGVMAGFKGNEVYLSEPYRPHAYPLVNRYAVNWPIVGLGVVETTLVVVTEAYPSIGRGVDPAAYSFKRHPGLFPGVSKRGVATGPIGVLWPTPFGVALCDGVNIVNATQEFVTRDEWRPGFFPTTIHATFHEGRYYGWFDNGTLDGNGNRLGGGFILDRAERAFLVKLGEFVYAAYDVPDEERLFLAKKNLQAGNLNYIFEWDADPTDPKAYEWKSKVFVANGLDNMAFGQIIADFGAGLSPEEIAALQAQIAAQIAFNIAQPDTDGPLNGNGAMSDQHGFELNGGAPLNGDTYLLEPIDEGFVSGVVTFRYWADGILVLTVDINSKEPFPLPAGILPEKHQLELAGSVEVTQVTIAGSAEELAAV
jgi:hypothetical protein